MHAESIRTYARLWSDGKEIVCRIGMPSCFAGLGTGLIVHSAYDGRAVPVRDDVPELPRYDFQAFVEYRLATESTD